MISVRESVLHFDKAIKKLIGMQIKKCSDIDCFYIDATSKACFHQNTDVVTKSTQESPGRWWSIKYKNLIFQIVQSMHREHAQRNICK